MDREEETRILWDECKKVFLESNNEELPKLLKNILEIIRRNYDIFQEEADLDFLDYVVNIDADEYMIGTNGDDFELRLKSYIQHTNISVQCIWQMLSQLIWDLIVTTTVKICPFCKCDNLVLLVDKEKKHIYESCENCFWISENEIQVRRPDELFPANKHMIKKRNYMQYINEKSAD